MAIGSRRTWPTVPAAAAVISEPMVEATKTPWPQLNAWKTSGTVVDRRPPKMRPLIGTPAGFSHSGSRLGHCDKGAVNRAFGCAALRPQSGVQGLPAQSVSLAGGSSVIPSHQTSPSSVMATFVKIVFFLIVSIALGLERYNVPGATPKKPFSGLMAKSWP